MNGGVLGIAGSPRRHGNSEQLLDACLSGVREAGGEAVKLVVRDYGIQPCEGCHACSEDGECVLRDRMHEIYPMLDGAEAVVVASPLFFATVPAVLKALYDRCQPYWARRYVLKQQPGPKRPGALLVAGGGGDPFGAEGAVLTTRSVFAVLRVEYAHELVVKGVDSPADIGRRTEDLARAGRIGAALAGARSG
ncbi:MAG: flavodoxin family protein [Coriobacteriia bacterium]|nr:flavodoxin family protein [Coriobacteriia bacterium]